MPMMAVFCGKYTDIDEPARQSTADGVSESAETRLSGMVLCSQSSPGFCTYLAV